MDHNDGDVLALLDTATRNIRSATDKIRAANPREFQDLIEFLPEARDVAAALERLVDFIGSEIWKRTTAEQTDEAEFDLTTRTAGIACLAMAGATGASRALLRYLDAAIGPMRQAPRTVET